MSVYIECDYCQDMWHEDDTPYMYESVEIDGEWYTHACESCVENTFLCDYCDKRYHTDNSGGRYCDTLDMWICEDDFADAHSDYEYWGGYCESCDYDDPAFVRTGQWTALIG
jgi:hypothetical protein